MEEKLDFSEYWNFLNSKLNLIDKIISFKILSYDIIFAIKSSCMI